MAARVATKVAQVAPGCAVRTELGSSLYHPDDLPEPEQWASLAHPRQKQRPRARRIDSPATSGVPSPGNPRWRERLALMPRVMGDWRRAARAASRPRPCAPTVDALTSSTLDAAGRVPPGELPELAELLGPALTTVPGSAIQHTTVIGVCRGVSKQYREMNCIAPCLRSSTKPAFKALSPKTKSGKSLATVAIITGRHVPRKPGCSIFDKGNVVTL